VSDRRDPDLDGILDNDPGLERYAHLLRAGRLQPPPLDPGFRHALRRELMTKAYDRYHRGSRPGFLARLFTGPRLAAATALVGVVMIAVLLLANSNLFGNGSVQVTTVGAVAVDQPILVSFSQPMDHQSVEQSIQIEPATQVTYTWQGDNLLIQPVSGELAPNTQYHVTVASAARTAPGTPIGQPATVEVTTAPLPSPSPTPEPSPTPTPEPQITAELQLAGTSGSLVGFSADGRSLFFLTPGGDLDQVRVDGSGQRTIHSGVSSASVAPADAALAYTVAGPGGGVYLGGPAGDSAQLVDSRSARVIGWLEGRPFLLAGTDLGTAGSAPVAKLPLPSDGSVELAELTLSPDGKQLIWTTSVPPTAGPKSSPSSYLMDIATQKIDGLPAVERDLAWSPDSTRVAYWSAGSVQVAAPDGTAPVTLAPDASPVQARWTDDGRKVLIGAGDGAWMVGSDGSDLHQLSQAAFDEPVWAPGDASVGFLRSGTIWVDQVATGGSASLDLGAAAAVVDAYERARIAGDGGTAAGLLGPSASPVAPSPIPGNERLERYFVISSQATATEARFTARLIFAHGKDEVRYQDELLVIVSTAGGLKIGNVSEGDPHDLGKGPTVNSVGVESFGLVITFDSDIDPASLRGVTVTGPDGQVSQITSIYGKRKLTLAFPMKAGAHYHLAIDDSVKDIAGHRLMGGYEYDFVAPAAAGSG
jgi:hypothetical protein